MNLEPVRRGRFVIWNFPFPTPGTNWAVNGRKVGSKWEVFGKFCNEKITQPIENQHKHAQNPKNENIFCEVGSSYSVLSSPTPKRIGLGNHANHLFIQIKPACR